MFGVGEWGVVMFGVGKRRIYGESCGVWSREKMLFTGLYKYQIVRPLTYIIIYLNIFLQGRLVNNKLFFVRLIYNQHLQLN